MSRRRPGRKATRIRSFLGSNVYYVLERKDGDLVQIHEWDHSVCNYRYLRQVFVPKEEFRK